MPESVPTVLAVLLLALGVGLWVFLHRLAPAIPLFRWLLRLAKVACGFCVVLLGLLVAQRWLLMTTSWPLWAPAAVGAVAVESLAGLYRLERRTVARPLGLTLTVLRVAAALLIVMMLAQPVRSLTLTDRIQRQVAVLLDESASMLIHDTALLPHEKFRLAERLGVSSAKRKYPIENVATSLTRLRDELGATLESLASLEPLHADDRQQRLADRRKDLEKLADRGLETLDDAVREIDGPLNDKGPTPVSANARSVLTDVRARLNLNARPALEQMAKFTRDRNSDHLGASYGELLDALRSAVTELGEAAPKADQASQTLDDGLFAGLSEARKAEINAISAWPRNKLARELLLRSAAEGDRPMLEQLLDKYTIRIYTFDTVCSPVDVEEFRRQTEALGVAATLPAAGAVAPDRPWAASMPPEDDPASQPASAPAADAKPSTADGTDLAGALRRVMSDLTDHGGDKLAGVVIFTDGRHNARSSVENAVRQLGMQRVPVCSVVMGSSRPPRDAAIIAIDAPDTVYAKDRMLIGVELKLDGLAGQTVAVQLHDGENVVDTREIRVEGDRVRTRVQLADTPERVGPHAYRVSVPQFEGEVFPDNNEYPLTLNVTDDRTRMLYIEGRPRWEARYLKNLFAARDTTLRLQYVLFEPDRIADLPDKPADQIVTASVSNPPDVIECDRLPANEAEWLKFDVILLGDVAPERLPRSALDAIRKFVTDHGGTLVIIPGPFDMPHAYLGTPLADLLPVSVRAAGAEETIAAPEQSYRWALTDEGVEHVLMRQEVDADANRTFWTQRPEMYWRYPIRSVKPGAAVLAYAMPFNAPSFMTTANPILPNIPASTTASQLASQEQILQQRKEFQATHALVVTQQVGMGQVLFLGTDRTWRLRYRAGDTYHHRFWGQVMRWATSSKLPSGTSFVKLGTDKARYAPGSRMTAKAKLSQADYSPLVSSKVSLNVYRGTDMVLRRAMVPASDTPGLYTADLGELPSGSYRLELDAPDAKELLEAENVETVSAEFSVDPSAPAEQVELSADRALLSHLAAVSGGKIVDPWQAASLLDALGEGVMVTHQTRQHTLWDTWPLLTMILLLVSAEWLVRKKVGLA
ncbi:MAG: hypothetical protein FWE88_05555 [Phycisphaerae bacterium]|nr:hypothetical protein [Phycisphaerae bacterium]